MFFSFLSYFQCVLCWCCCFLFIRATGSGIQWDCKWFAFGLLSECRMWRWHSGYLLVFGSLVGWHISVRTCVPTVRGSVCCCSRALGSNLISQPPVRFWGSDVHRQRSQLPLCLPLETPHLFSLPSLPLFCSVYLHQHPTWVPSSLPIPPLPLPCWRQLCVSHFWHLHKPIWMHFQNPLEQ